MHRTKFGFASEAAKYPQNLKFALKCFIARNLITIMSCRSMNNPLNSKNI